VYDGEREGGQLTSPRRLSAGASSRVEFRPHSPDRRARGKALARLSDIGPIFPSLG